MLKRIEKQNICVKSLEEGPEGYLKVTFNSLYGNYSILALKKHALVFLPGTKYEGIFAVSGMPDFVGDEDKWENVCTMNFCLEKIIGKDILLGNGKINGMVEGNLLGMFGEIKKEDEVKKFIDCLRRMGKQKIRN
jgi:hypothetical protein